ncbi:MAG: YncE family protein [Mariniphaga sp.]|nr:YncE family protein [Mariniphaga sp.]
MKSVYPIKTIALLSVCCLLIVQLSSGQVQNKNANASLKLIAFILLPDVSGRIDHLAYNSKKQLIYVAALGNNTVEVVDLKSKKVIHSIKGLDEPQGIRYIPETNVVFIANGGNGECTVFDAETYKPVAKVKLGGDADNVRYNPATNQIFVGYSAGAIAILDGKTYKQLADIKLAGHPESFQLEGDSKIYVNVPDAHLLEVIDLKKNTIAEKWKIEEATANFPMALDAVNHRLFIGCRHPAKLLVISTETGKKVASMDTNGDTDDIFYDTVTKQILMSCGDGTVDVFTQISPDKYEAVSKIETRSGARTALFVPELNQIIVAAPARSGKEAQLMVYEKK